MVINLSMTYFIACFKITRVLSTCCRSFFECVILWIVRTNHVQKAKSMLPNIKEKEKKNLNVTMVKYFFIIDDGYMGCNML